MGLSTNESQTYEAEPTIEVVPKNALLDREVAIRVVGLPPNQVTTLEAEMLDDAGRTWRSHAAFQSDANGSVDVALQKPLSGTYHGIDSMGLFWSMELRNNTENQSGFAKSTLEPLEVALSAKVSGALVTTANVKRHLLAPDVVREPIKHNGLVGTYFRPTGEPPFPSVIVLGGSEGGVREIPAALFAAHGFASFAVGYFGIGELPSSLSEIPLEYIKSAKEWLESLPETSEQMAVVGASRGGELALLLGATFPGVNAVVAYVTSSVVWCGYGPDGPVDGPAWTYQGQDVSYVPDYTEPSTEIVSGDSGNGQEPIKLAPSFLVHLENNPDLVHC